MKPVVLATAMAGLLLGSHVLYAQTTQKTAPATNSAPGNDNQAVAMTSANAPAPAAGANSFTMGEAKSRIESDGFTNVSGLSEDSNGVWHGNAQKGGNTTTVWLDYKGNVGQGK